MRIGLPLLLIVLLNAAAVTADAIRYDQIPADVSSYAHVDVDRAIITSFFMDKPPGASQDAAAMLEATYGIRLASITVYTLGDSELVALLHCKEKLRQRWEAKAATGKDAILFSYDNQDIYYSSDNPWVSDSLAAAFGARRNPKRPQPQESPTEPQMNVGIGVDPDEIRRMMNGPVYTAFVGQDFAVATTDLPSMAHALNVVQGKKPSLANQDPHGLKADMPPGVILQGAGLMAEINAENLNHPAKQPDDSTDGSGFGLDLIGTFKGKARLARFDLGQDEHDLYLNATLAMIDAESAEQLKNLIIGVKALISLSEADQKPLIDPLEIQVVGTDVVLHWKWPTANLSELIRLTKIRSNHAEPLPATSPVEPKSSAVP
jgi:hypothetical protein